MIYLDTHVAAWLYAGRRELFPAAAQQLLEEEDLLISPMVGLELQYLYEIQRVTVPAARVLEALQTELGLTVCDLPFPRVAAVAWDEGWTRDPFDRLIVSQAKVRGAPLLTKDGTIHSHYALAVWRG